MGTEEIAPVPKNIYGITKLAAERLWHLFHRNHGLVCIVLRTSRFFPEEDDDRKMREAYPSDNLKVNEVLFRRVDLEDAVAAHLLAAQRARAIGFGTYIISATTPFLPEDAAELRTNAPAVVERRVPDYQAEYERRGWRMLRASTEFTSTNERERSFAGSQNTNSNISSTTYGLETICEVLWLG